MSHRKESFESQGSEDSSQESSWDDSDDSDDSELYDDLIETTLEARKEIRAQLSHQTNADTDTADADKKKRRPKPPLRRSRYMEKVFNTILDLTDEILEDWKDKVFEAAENGFSNVNIYEYGSGEKYRDIPIVMLMCGPKNKSNFFKNNGMFNVVEEVQMELGSYRLRVEYKYVGKGKNVINVSWRDGLYNRETFNATKSPRRKSQSPKFEKNFKK